MILYHAGFSVIEKPDLTVGRRNADFGQGFYLSDDREFSLRWARGRRGETTWLNRYELDTQGLNMLRLERGPAWFALIRANRAA